MLLCPRASLQGRAFEDRVPQLIQRSLEGTRALIIETFEKSRKSLCPPGGTWDNRGVVEPSSFAGDSSGELLAAVASEPWRYDR
jgi:hypothetical protein